MHSHDIEAWQHSHDFITATEGVAERRTRWVVFLTLAAMVVELTAGWLTGSMALLADGWHMGSHAAALGISVFAYGYARRRQPCLHPLHRHPRSQAGGALPATVGGRSRHRSSHCGGASV